MDVKAKLEKAGIEVKNDKIAKADIERAKQVIQSAKADAEAIGSAIEDELNDVRDAIHKLKMKFYESGYPKSGNKRVIGIVNKLTNLDDEISDIL